MNTLGVPSMRKRSLTSPRRWPAWVLLGVVVVALLVLGWARHGAGVLAGDEATFLSMAQSLAYDADLRFSREDRERLAGGALEGAHTLILGRTEHGLVYSKPVLYPLMAAPLVLLLGRYGLIGLNLIAVVLAVLLALRYLRRSGTSAAADWAVVTFLGTGVVLAYVAWMMSDALQFALVLAGGALCLGSAQPVSERPWRSMPAAAAIVGGILLAMFTVMRWPNGLLAVAILAATWTDSGKRSSQAAAAFLGGVGVCVLLTWGLLGTPDPYSAPRTSFAQRDGYPTTVSQFDESFAEHPATHHMKVSKRLEPLVSLYSALYFVIGRHTGLLLYYPVTLLLAAMVMLRGGRREWLLLGGAAALALFYLLWVPRNYFGGGTFLGNRYFLAAAPLLLLALPRLPRPRTWLPVWIVAIVALLSASVSVARVTERSYDSQSHAYAGAFRLLPYDSTGHVIGTGVRDRYWAGDLVRFVDPFARLRGREFRLPAGRPPAELMIASARSQDVALLAVETDSRYAALIVDGWRGEERYPLAPQASGSAGVMRVRLASAWRHHTFWWRTDAIYSVWLVRLHVENPEGETLSARVRYLGAP